MQYSLSDNTVSHDNKKNGNVSTKQNPLFCNDTIISPET